jgi:cellulose synthase/poly-beta-1,6-N-acetylglucosamine synthase-like glycosyltransferase
MEGALHTAAAATLAVCAALLAYAFVGYPLLVRGLALLRPRPFRPAPIEPTVSFLIAAYNEEAVIAEKLENTLALDYPRDKLEIVVASDGSTDGTHAVVERFAERGVRLFVPEGHLGKTGTANAAVPTTRGEILVFSDATGMYNREAVRALVRNFADARVGAVTGRVLYRYDESVTARGFEAYQRLVVPQRRAESVFGTETSVSGSIHAVRRERFAAAPPELSFDIVHPLHVALSGQRTVYEAEATSLEDARSRPEDEFRSRVRIAVRMWSFVPYLLARLPSCRDAMYVFQVVSHKLLRWLSAPLLALAAAAAAVLATRGGLHALPLLALGCAAGAAALGWLAARLGRGAGPFAAALVFATLELAYLVGLARWLRGARFAGWRPER